MNMYQTLYVNMCSTLWVLDTYTTGMVEVQTPNPRLRASKTHKAVRSSGDLLEADLHKSELSSAETAAADPHTPTI